MSTNSSPNAALPLDGKVSLVTGSTRGIGLSIAQQLSRLGSKVVVNFASDSSASLANDLVSKLGGPDKAIAVQADVGDVKEIERLVAATVEKWGKIDVLVANAAVMQLNELEKVTEGEFDNIFKTNVKGPFFLAQKSAPHMPPGSRIILFSTTLCAASTVSPNYIAYVSSKGAVEQLTRVLSKDLARKGIRVNCVAPGPTATDMFLTGKSEQLLNAIKSAIPLGRLGEPQEIAEVVGFLAGEGSRWVTGQVVRVNGGLA